MATKATSNKARVVTRKHAKPRSTWRKPVKGLLALVVIGVAGAAGYGFYLFNQKIAEARTRVENFSAMIDLVDVPPTKIYSADGVLLYQSINIFRKPVELDKIPQHVIDATLAAEDKRFYQHNGVDEWAIARQIVTNAREQRVAGGASTITMQLAKRAFSQSEKTITRKIDDMALAFELERKLTKDEILQYYLNEVYYGSGAYGIKAAALVYFNKPLEKISIGEAALLARLVRRPSDENPYINLKKATTNRNVVLNIMHEEGMITEEELAAAKAEEVKLGEGPKSRTVVHKAPYFVNYVLSEIKKMPEMRDVDLSSGGYIIRTTLDTRVQAVSDKESRDIVRQHRGWGVRQAAFLLTRRDGSIVSMTGGIDFEKRQFNATTQGGRQPGSSFKPFVYGVAFDKTGLRPSTPISNATYRYRSGQRVLGNGAMMSARSAFMWSKNPAALVVLNKWVTPSKFVREAKNTFGFTSEMPAVESLVLGSTAVRPIEMAEAYSVFQTKGNRVRPFGIRSITDPSGRKIFEFLEGSNVVRTDFSSAAAWDVDDCMRAVVFEGTAAKSGIAGMVRNARGKTGTTNDNRDAWFCGYTNSYIGIGWVSGERVVNDKLLYPEMSEAVMGGTVTSRLWRDIVSYAQKELGEDDEIETPRTGRRGGWGSPDPEAAGDGGSPVTIDTDGDGQPDQDTAPAPVNGGSPEPGPGPEPDTTPVQEDPPQEPVEPPTLPEGNPLPEGPGGNPPPDEGETWQ